MIQINVFGHFYYSLKGLEINHNAELLIYNDLQYRLKTNVGKIICLIGGIA